MMMPRVREQVVSEVVGSKCDFCEGKTINSQYMKSGLITKKNKYSTMFNTVDKYRWEDGIWLENGNLLTYDSSSGEYASQGVEIKYCPFCGKELEGDTDGK